MIYKIVINFSKTNLIFSIATLRIQTQALNVTVRRNTSFDRSILVLDTKHKHHQSLLCYLDFGQIRTQLKRFAVNLHDQDSKDEKTKISLLLRKT